MTLQNNIDINNIEKVTSDQHKSNLWHELRYDRVTASQAFEFSRCKTKDESLIALIMGGKIPDTPAMTCGRLMEDDVRKTISALLRKRIKKCGLMISKNFKNYICNGKPTQKYYV